ncbi:NRPS-like enzyme protein [Rutstroemia sp. NJR-2017a WRK4]|nr:NRPS-like enzyme protein [Rutstroemia sp. NJR-2017a WRK4]
MPTLQFSETPTPPQPLFPQRKQLLNHIVDGLAQARPESIWAKIPRDSLSYDAGYRKITYRMMANAINGMAWWIKSELGESKGFETLAYFGPWDPRYIIILLASVKAGYKMIFPSPGYPLIGLTKLLGQLECQKVLTSSNKYDIVSKLSSESGRDTHEIPSLSKLLDQEYEHYPFNKTFESAKSEPLIVVHTSGTTGMPKPLIYTHGWVASWIEQNQLPVPKGHTSLEHIIHGIEASSLLPNLFGAIPNQLRVLFPLPDSPVTWATALEMIRHNSPDLLLAPAHVLDGLASDIKYINEISQKVSMVSFGGGPLSESTGDILTKHFRVFGMYGTSEIGTIHKIIPTGPWDTRTWNSWKPHPKENMQFRHLQDDVYEAVIVRNSSVEEEQAVFQMFPKLQEYPTKDMFSPDPHREGFWSYRGRVDDLIKLSTGGSVNPSKYEEMISSAPFVKAAVMCGTGKPKTALLVELLEPLSEGSSVLEDLYALVDATNNEFPPQTSIAKSHIVITSPSKPLPRAAKGSVQRAPALELYRAEIDGLYGYISV